MKTVIRFFGVVAVALAGLTTLPAHAAEDPIVQKAYALRISGKADDAKALLEQAVSEDPANAEAWYELARTTAHIGLGAGGRGAGDFVEEQYKAIEQAAEQDPDNVIYAIYKANACMLRAYIPLMRQQPDAGEKVKEAVAAYEAVLRLKPDYHEAKLHLVELLKMVPPDMGGDPAKAEQYAEELEKADAVYGAMAREMMLPDDADRIAFWKKVLEENTDNADVLERLGKAYLYEQKEDEGIPYLNEAMRIDPGKATLHLDIGRHYMYQAMRDRGKLASLAPKIEEAFNAYLQSKPEPINPIKAWAKGHLAMVEFQTGDKESGDKLRKEAETLDPNYSKATAIPGKILFTPPDEIPRGFSYFSRPF